MSSRALHSYIPVQRGVGLRWAAPAVIFLSASVSFVWQALELRDWLTQPVALPPPLVANPSSAGVSTAMTQLFGTQGRLVQPSEHRLRLRASFVHSEPSRSSALIVVDNARPQRLYPGDEIEPGLMLAEIHADHVLLKRAGVLQNLGLRRTTEEARP